MLEEIIYLAQKLQHKPADEAIKERLERLKKVFR